MILCVAMALLWLVPARGAALDQMALVQLDQLRAVGAVDAERAEQLLQSGRASVETARRQQQAEVSSPPTAQQRLAACQAAFMEAELYRRAALVMPADDAQRGERLAQALELYRALRLEYRELSISHLGYAGEARVHRANGELEQAEKVLAPVVMALVDKRLAQQPAGTLQVQRLLWLERVENALAQSPAQGLALAGQLGGGALMSGASPAEKAALRWLELRARAAEMLAGGSGDAEALAKELREAELVSAVPAHERLALLKKLSQAAPVALATDELLQWARLAAWANLPEQAIEGYAAAVAQGAQEIPPQDWQTYGSLLYRAGQLDTAADVLANALDSAADGAQRLGMLQAIAAGRLHAARQNAADGAARAAALEALWQLASAATDDDVRRDALRSWAYLHQQAGTLDEHRDVLMQYRADVENDPYLALLVSESMWRMAQRAGPAEVGSIRQEIESTLQRLLPQADRELAPSLVLLLARVAPGPREALDVMAHHEPSLAADAPATPQLMALKLQLLMQLGLSSEAEALAARLDSSAVTPQTALRLAEMLAERYARSPDSPQRASLHGSVVRLVERGLKQHQRDGQYRDLALTAARILIRVESYVDAEHILAGVRSSADDATDAAAALLLVEALQGQGNIEAARKTLDDVARKHPEAGEVHLAMGRLQQQLRQWPAAAEAYRAAREHLPAGREAWWQATVGLAETLVEQGHAPAAQQLMRVASALYRNGAPASLLPRIDSLISSSAPKQS